MKCQNCCKQYFCENFKQKDDCEEIVSWLETKNYGEVKKLEDNTWVIKNTK
jgi:hypothetical protein